jgi:ParB family chromosome partitioning protein
VAQIREQGQMVPILVRPHPKQPGRYQVAFGHRRLLAAKELGRPVRAVVRELSDQELIVAQGQENSAREDLSYIEKAFFAQRLEKSGFSRAVIQRALAVHKSDLSQMLTIASQIPESLVRNIGAAPSAGRRSWLQLASALSNDGALTAVEALFEDPSSNSLDSDARFKRALTRASPDLERSIVETWSGAQGQLIAKLRRNKNEVSLTIDRRKSPEFADFVLEQLREIYLRKAREA